MSTGNALAWLYVGNAVYSGLQATKKRDELLEYLEADPLNPKRHQEFLIGLNKLKGLGHAEAPPVYRRVLEILMDNPDSPQATDLVLKTGQWYFQVREPARTFTLDHLSQIQTLLLKKKEIEELIEKVENDRDSDFLHASRRIGRFELSGFEDNAIRSRVVDLHREFLYKFMNSLLKRMASMPTDKELHHLLKNSFEVFDNPNYSIYEEYLLALLNSVVAEPKNKELRNFFMYSLDKAPNSVNNLNIYNAILSLFEHSSFQQELRVLVLDVGRWHFSRKNWLRRRPKPADEQQMQNDILMRLKN